MHVCESKPQNPTNTTIEESPPIDTNLLSITFELMWIIQEAQSQHGLRHGDYQRYRGYCSRRIARLRSVLGIKQGDRRHYKKRDVTEAHMNHSKGDVRPLHIPLMMAERCWAHAMQLRQESNTEQRKRFHFIEKLRKACVYANALNDLAQVEQCDARTKLETQAYLAWMHGLLHFDLKSWKSASDNLKKSQVIYEKIMSTLEDDEQVAYKRRIDEIKPSLRYCAYNVGDDNVDLLELRSMGLQESFVQLVTQNKKKTAAVLHAISWHGIEVPIRTDRVRLFLCAMDNLDAAIGKAESAQKKIKIIEDMFIELRDVIADMRKDPKEHLVLSYLLSIRIDRTVQRNLLLIKLTKKPHDICRLFDIIIQQTNEMIAMDVLQDNERAQSEYKQKLRGYQTMRTIYMAQAHMFYRRWKEAIVTYDVGLMRLKELHDGHENDIVNAQLLRKAQSERAIAHANMVMEKFEEDTQSTSQLPVKMYKRKKPLVERLGEFREDPQLLSKNPNAVPTPIPMTMLPPKPIFFDLALNLVQMPTSLQAQVEERKKDKETSSISRLVKGLWGWRN